MTRSKFLAAALGLICAGPVWAQDGDKTGVSVTFGSYNVEPMSNYAPDSIFRQFGRAVGRLDIATDKGVFPCTAFLVEGDRLLTTHHCVPGLLDHPRIDATKIVAVQFVAGYVLRGKEDGTEKFEVDPVPLEDSKDLDYAVLKVLRDPTARFGFLPLGDAPVPDNVPLWLIGHPMGEEQHISREGCQSSAPALLGNRLRHSCDTLAGSGGGPLIDPQSGRVVAMHHAGSRRDAINFAIPMTEILGQSAVLTAAPEAGNDDLLALLDALGDSDPEALRTTLEALHANAPTEARRARIRALLEMLP